MSKNNITNNSYVSEIGICLLLFGVSILSYRLFPEFKYTLGFIFNIPMLLIFMGVLRGINTNFKTNDWWIFLLVGGFLYLSKIVKLIPGVNPELIFPIGIIVIGIILIAKRRRKIIPNQSMYSYENDIPILPIDNVDGNSNQYNQNVHEPTDKINNANDELHIETVLGNNNRMVISKNFKGGYCSTILGNSTIYLNKADFDGTIYINNFCLLGETTIIVPAQFNIINQITSVLGSVEDKRNFMQEHNQHKSIILKGQCILGSVTIKNF